MSNNQEGPKVMGRFQVFDEGSDDTRRQLESVGSGGEDNKNVGVGVDQPRRKNSLPPAESFQIPAKDILFLGAIGRGSFGTVYRGKVWGQDVALKKLHQDVDLREDFDKEVQIMCATRHPNIVEFLGFCNEPGSRCIITELLSSHNLESLLIEMEKSQKRFPLSQVLKFAKDIACGVNWLHHKGIIHRDLKPSNVFLDANGKCRIGDFGLAYARRDVDSPTNHEFYGICGTYCYIAPEIMRRERYGGKADVFSFAMILCELASGRYPFNHHPYNNATQIQQELVSGFRPPIPSDVNPKLAQLIRDAWADDSTKRPSMDDVMERLNEIGNELPPTENKVSQEELEAEVINLRCQVAAAKELARATTETLTDFKTQQIQAIALELKPSVHDLLKGKPKVPKEKPKKDQTGQAGPAVTGKPSYYHATT